MGDIKDIVRSSVISATDGKLRDFDIKRSEEGKGDLSVSAVFKFAKEQNRNPGELSQEIAEKINSAHFPGIDYVQSVNGYLNYFISNQYLQEQLLKIYNNKDYGKSEEGKGKTVIIEYSSPNIAKPMHIGHLRSTIIGDALANVYEELGYKVARWNFIGDWGTQFGILIAAWKKWGEGKMGVSFMGLLQLYVRANKELSEDEGRAEFKKLEEGDRENREIWEMLLKISVVYFEEIYEKLGVSLDFNSKGESDYEPKLKPLIEKLVKKGLAKESEGALIIELENLPPALIRKSDGATLYITRDIASLEDRIKNYNPEKILYVVANQQSLHFEQLFAVANKLKLNTAELVHVKFGMVLGEDGKKLATREGKVIALEEVLEKITNLAFETVKQKNSDLSEAEAKEISRVVGLGALKYNDLRQHPYSDITFDWKAMLDLSGNSGPYLQYTYARLVNIISKAGKYEAGDPTHLVEPVEVNLMKLLLDFPESITGAARSYTLNGLALFLYEFASVANKFYETLRVLEDDNVARRNARLMLVGTVARTLKDGLKLLGIETLDRI